MNFLHRIRCRLFPELLRFPIKESGLELDKVMRTLFSGMQVVYFFFIGVVIFIMNSLLFWFLPTILVKIEHQIVAGAIFAITTSIAIPLFFILYFRKLIVLALRRQLNSQGLPCCMKCGYDLSCNESGICPECGMQIVLDK